MARAAAALALSLLALPWFACQRAGEPASSEAPAASAERAAPTSARIVSVGGAVTECLFALGVGDAVVGVDTSSLWPPTATARPKVGYQRAVAAEGVLSLDPTVVFAVHEVGPPAAVAQIEGAGVTVVKLDDVTTVAQAHARLRTLAGRVGAEAAAERLVARTDAALSALSERLSAATERPRVLFIYARGPGQAFVAGEGTSAEEAIRLAGGAPAVRGLTGFAPLTAEAVVAAAPDVVAAPARAVQSLGGRQGLLALPGLAETPAGKAGRIVEVDDLALLGFGPRLPDALVSFAAALHPALPDLSADALGLAPLTLDQAQDPATEVAP